MITFVKKQMKRYRLNGTYFYCPVDLTLQIISGRWKGIVIWNLREKKMRYGELKKTLVSINDKTLSQVLKDLQKTIPTLIYYTNPGPNGFGMAIRYGLERFKGDCVAVMMADLSDDPNDLVKYYRTMCKKYLKMTLKNRLIS